jgi:hypothetical protein
MLTALPRLQMRRTAGGLWMLPLETQCLCSQSFEISSFSLSRLLTQLAMPPYQKSFNFMPLPSTLSIET